MLFYIPVTKPAGKGLYSGIIGKGKFALIQARLVLRLTFIEFNESALIKKAPL
jgi:hypothetical protein